MTPAPLERVRRAVGVRLGLLFAAIFFVTGSALPYLPVWLAWRELSAPEIAIISAGPQFVRVLVTPAIAFAADRAGDHRRFLILLAWSAVACHALLAQMRGFLPILLTCLLLAVAWTSIMPLTEAIAIRGVKAVRLDYGRMRLWGSISFTTAALAGGWLLERASPQALFYLLIGGCLVLAGAAHALAKPPRAEPAAPRMRAQLRARDVAQLLATPTFLVFLLAAGAIQAAHAAFYTFGTLHWRALGLTTLVAGQLWTVGVAAEILVFAYSAALIGRVGPTSTLVLAGLAAVARWLAMAFDPPVWLLFALQALHGLTFGAAHVGAIHFLARFVPEAQSGTAQAVYASATSGILLGGATLLAGPLYAAWGGRAYFAMAGLAAVGLLAALALARLSRTAPRRPGPKS